MHEAGTVNGISRPFAMEKLIDREKKYLMEDDRKAAKALAKNVQHLSPYQNESMMDLINYHLYEKIQA